MKRTLAALALLLTFIVSALPANAVVINGETLWRWETRTVYVADHVGSHWPVAWAARNWSNGTPLTLKPRNNCPRWHGCIIVNAGNYGPNGSGAWTSWTLVNNVIEHVTITINTYYWRQPYRAVCHEMGHASGIYTHLGTHSCLYYANVSWVRAYPGKYAKRLLRRLYK